MKIFFNYRANSSLVDGIYLWFSLILLICRTLAVCWFSSKIHDESLKPLPVVRSISSDYYDINVSFIREKDSS